MEKEETINPDIENKDIPKDENGNNPNESKEEEISIEDQVNKFKDKNNIIEVGIDHKEYSHTTKFSEDNIKALSADFN